MSDPVARYYETVIREEIERQSAAKPTVLDATDLDVAAIAKALAGQPKQLDALLEPGAGRFGGANVSAAISLKRIADVLAGSERREGLADTVANWFIRQH